MIHFEPNESLKSRLGKIGSQMEKTATECVQRALLPDERSQLEKEVVEMIAAIEKEKLELRVKLQELKKKWRSAEATVKRKALMVENNLYEGIEKVFLVFCPEKYEVFVYSSVNAELLYTRPMSPDEKQLKLGFLQSEADSVLSEAKEKNEAEEEKRSKNKQKAHKERTKNAQKMHPAHSAVTFDPNPDELYGRPTSL